MMTNTKWTSRILGTAWPQHFNKPVAEAMYAEHQEGRPAEVERGRPGAGEGRCRRSSATRRRTGLATKLAELGEPVKNEDKRGGGSDDIGDVSWTVPTVTLRYPANIPGLPGHNWSSAIAMATPIAHKGVVAGAKVQAMTDARPAHQARARDAGLGLLPQRPDQGREVHPVHHQGHAAGDLPERQHPRRSTARR